MRLQEKTNRKGKSMGLIISIIGKMGNMALENVAMISLLLHTLLWFVLGGCAGAILAICMQLSGGQGLSYIVTVGSVCALVFGYICGVVYLLRWEA